MAEQQAYHRNSMLMPILAGLAGAGLALLFAPRSGKDTRDMVRNNAHDMKESARGTLDSSMNQARELKDRIQSVVQTTKRKAKDEMDEMRDQQRNESTNMTSWDKEV